MHFASLLVKSGVPVENAIEASDHVPLEYTNFSECPILTHYALIQPATSRWNYFYVAQNKVHNLINGVWNLACFHSPWVSSWNSLFTGGAVGSRRVLVVDDDQESRNLLSEVLGANGYPVLAVEGSEAVWEALRQDSSRAIILIDLRMPGESGLELLRKLQQRKVKCDAILMSSFISGTERELAQKLGVKEFLEKPFRLSELLRVVGELATKNPIEISS